MTTIIGRCPGCGHPKEICICPTIDHHPAPKYPPESYCSKCQKDPDECVCGKKEGVKWDGGKIRLDLMPIRALEEVGKVFTFGVKKYGERNWEKGMNWGRLFGASLRHLFAFWRGEEIDPETGLPHLAQATWNTLCLLEYFLTGKGEDDRSK